MINQVWQERIKNEYPFIRRCAKRLVSDRDAAFDLAQDVVLHVLGQEHNFHSGNLKGWLRTACYNLFINQYRKDKRFQKSGTASDSLYEGYSNLNIGLNNGDLALNAQMIMLAIERLDDRPRKVVTLRIQGYKYQEIAVKLGIPVGSVRSNLFRARELLEYYIKKPNASILTVPMDEE